MRFFSLIYQGDVHPSSEDGIIPSEEFSTLMEAKEVLEKTKEDSALFKQELATHAEELRKQAEKEGFEKGLEQFNEKLAWFDRELKALRIELQTQILPIALKAARKVVGGELTIRPEAIIDIVIQALAPVLQSKQVTIYVNKQDRELLETAKPQLKNILEQADSLTILDRADVSPGGCIIETPEGIINATIENQWRAMDAAFERYRNLL